MMTEPACMIKEVGDASDVESLLGVCGCRMAGEDVADEFTGEIGSFSASSAQSNFFAGGESQHSCLAVM